MVEILEKKRPTCKGRRAEVEQDRVKILLKDIQRKQAVLFCNLCTTLFLFAIISFQLMLIILALAHFMNFGYQELKESEDITGAKVSESSHLLEHSQADQ